MIDLCCWQWGTAWGQTCWGERHLPRLFGTCRGNVFASCVSVATYKTDQIAFDTSTHTHTHTQSIECASSPHLCPDASALLSLAGKETACSCCCSGCVLLLLLVGCPVSRGEDLAWRTKRAFLSTFTACVCVIGCMLLRILSCHGYVQLIQHNTDLAHHTQHITLSCHTPAACCWAARASPHAPQRCLSDQAWTA